MWERGSEGAREREKKILSFLTHLLVFGELRALPSHTHTLTSPLVVYILISNSRYNSTKSLDNLEHINPVFLRVD